MIHYVSVIGSDDYSLADAVSVLKIVCGISADAAGSDADGDGKIGLEDAVYVLQKLAELRN